MRLFRLRSSRLPALAVIALFLIFESASAQAHDAAATAPLDCGAAGTMMDQAKKTVAPEMTGDIDRDTAVAMRMHMMLVMQMAKIEAACGKDPKMQAAAKKMLDDSTALVNAVQRLSSPY